jgi:hypothetical protein
MARSLITDNILGQLKTAYPRSVCYSDLYRNALPGVGQSERIDQNGGSRFKTLVKQGKIKRVVEGFYVWIPS